MFEHYAGNIVESINFNGSQDADFEGVGSYIMDNYLTVNKKDVIEAAKAALQKATPIPLTGIIKKDGIALIKYIVAAFKKYGVNLDGDNAIVNSPNFANEIEIPVIGEKAQELGIFFQTHLDYIELASAGSNYEITVGGDFASEDLGSLDFVVSNLNDGGQIAKAANDFLRYLNTQE